MWWLFQWAVLYVLGGLTFVPLLIVAIIGYVRIYGSTPIGDPDPSKEMKAKIQEEHEKNTSTPSTKGPSISGWLTVRRQFEPIPKNNNGSLLSVSSSLNMANTSVDKEKEKEKEKEAEEANGSTYSARIAQTYKAMMEARSKAASTPKEFYFAVLKGTVLFLYEDEDQAECAAAIGLDRYTVGVEGSKDASGVFKGKDAEMFAKRNAIVLRMNETEERALPVLMKNMGANDEEKESEAAPWFLFSKSNVKMEDWYISLLQASAHDTSTDQVFSISDMQCLVDKVDAEPDPIPMRWLNAMIGRLFFGLYKTAALEQFIIDKIMKKLTKVPRPSFLSPIVVREVNVGTSAPYFSKPMLKDLTASGTAAFEVNVNYRARPSQADSEVRITIATTATIPTGFKPYVVDLVLAVVLKSIEGNMIVQIKKPPSNRVWYGFTHMPKMEVEIVPIVSERKIQIGMVLKAIEKQLREVIAESIVLPAMDDIAFFDTSALNLRGGVFSEAGKVDESEKSELVEEPIDLTVSKEDPSSAVPEVPGLRKRGHVAKATSVDVDSDGVKPDHDPDLTIHKVDTAPALDSHGNGSKRLSGVLTAKKWFATTTAAANRSSTRTSLDDSDDELVKVRSRSSERGANIANTPEVAPVNVSTATADQVEDASNPIHPHPLAAAPSEASLYSSFPHPEPSPSPSSNPSLISTLRSRDKKAIAMQVNSARDTVKKWGVNWAAKRRAGLPNDHLDERDEDKPAALYRPPEEDGPRSLEVKSLKERLDAAAAASAPVSIPPSPTGNRERSGSTLSQSRSMLSTSNSSQPDFKVTASKPTTAASIPPPPPPVKMQPSGSASMKVPRINKRPGEVTSLGSGTRTEMERVASEPVNILKAKTPPSVHTPSSPQPEADLPRRDSAPLPVAASSTPQVDPERLPRQSSLPMEDPREMEPAAPVPLDVQHSESPTTPSAQDVLRLVAKRDEEALKKNEG
ncbi:hypothetical protein P7C73_g4034, partial [Tremellales sp. Uapishka_1]